jgi:molybdenum cofactor biosynthesis enzyme MoaA
VARLFVAHGVEKIRITGGEPLLRKNIEFLIERLARLTTTTAAARPHADHQRLAARAQGAPRTPASRA